MISPLEAVLVVVATFFLSIFVGAIILLTLGDAVTLVLGELIILLVPLGFMAFKRVSIRSYVPMEVKPKFILLGLAFGVVLVLIDIVVSNVLTAIFGVSQAVEESNTLLTGLSGSAWGLAAVVASLALAGVCEEFAFRGFLQNALNRRFSFLPSVLISAAAFGIFHFDPQGVYILSAFISGLVLGYVYHRWNSYVVSALAHSTLNLIVLALLLLGL